MMAKQATYRRDIDGLRSLAVVPVVLFHAGFKTFSGGFVGVDVFFVISGYLITDHLYRETQGGGGIDIARFYERRVRRIFPSLFFMLACVLAAGCLLMLPGELAKLARSSVATTFFVSNFFFYFDSGYFTQSAIFKPLLHTWSLAVEEQYYIFWPLILWAVQRFAPQRMLLVTIVLAIGSLLLSIVAIRYYESATFYMLPTRAWELLAGGLLAISRWSPKRGREGIAWLGVALVLAAVLFYTERTVFPGAAAIPPVLGAVLILAAADGTSLGRTLSMLPLRGIGLISYSLYLWHWPILVFARLIYGPELPLSVAVVCVLLATLAATLSWRFVEQPFRKPASRTKGTRGPLMAGAFVMVTVSVAAVSLADGLPRRLPPKVIAIAAVDTVPDPKAFPCWVPQGANPDVARCLSGTDGRRKVLLWGDSHIRPFAQPLKQRVADRVDIRVIGRGGCSPFAGFEPVTLGRADAVCGKLDSQVLDTVAATPDIATVVIVGRWARLFFPDSSEEAQRLVDDHGKAVDPSAALTQSFVTIVARLTAAGKQVVILGDAPEFHISQPECLARAAWLQTDAARCGHEAETLPGSLSDRTLRAIAAAEPAVHFVWPADALCQGGECRSMLGGLPVSRDTDHLTDAAAGFVIDRTGLADLLLKH